MGFEKPLIGIIGGTGKTGSQFKAFFEKDGYEVLVCGRETKLTPKELAQKADVLIFSVPIKNTVEVIKDIAPFAKPGAMITDFTSIKKQPVEAMLKYAPETCEVVGMHPMFGPTIKSMKGQIVVLCKGRGNKGFVWLKRFLEENNVDVKEILPEKHDQIMSVVQGITHFSSLVVARAIEKSGLSLKDTLEYASPVYKLQLYTIGRILSQNPELYASIQMDNQEIRRRAEQFTNVSMEMSEFVKNKDYNNFIKKFEDIAQYFGNFKKESLEKTDYFIERLVNYPKNLSKKTDLKELRDEIDKINNEFVDLLKRRELLVKKVAIIKKKKNLLVYDANRETEIFGKIEEKAKEHNINPYEARDFFENILERSKNIMYLIKKPEVWTLGPAGCYSEEITSKLFSAKEIGYKTLIQDVFEEVSKNTSIGVVPIENSTGGSVDETVNSLIKYENIQIIGEDFLPIRHCLIGFSWAKIKGIKEIRAHTQSFAQCARFLQENFPDLRRTPCASNSLALKEVRSLHNGKIAAIASERAAKIYGLRVLKKNIHNNENNITKFIIISGKSLDTQPTGKDRISLLISYKEDKPKILFGVLKAFADENINLSKVESVPDGEFGKYLFFIDAEGHIKDEKIAKVVDEIKKDENLKIRFLGSYKRKREYG